MSSYLNTEPDLDETETIIESYPAESYLVLRDDPENGQTYRFFAPAREAKTFKDEERARLFADLYLVVDGFRVKDGVGEKGIPVNVAASGKPAIAAYMYAVWGSTPTHIAQKIDTNRQTVLDYIEQIRQTAAGVIEDTSEPETPPGELG